MVRGVLERAFDAGRLDALFDKTAERGYTRELLFSTVVRLMSEVVLGVSPSVHEADLIWVSQYLHQRWRLVM
jgi:phosphoribulokinase